jgi:methionyl-tRNA formyltransferase
VLVDVICQIENGVEKRIPQNSIASVGFYCGKRQEGDEIIDWKKSSREIYNFIRALTYPGPLAKSYIGDKEIKIVKAKLIDGAVDYIGICGQVVGVGSKREQLQKNAIVSRDLIIKTGDNTIRITEYEHSCVVKIGDRLK